MDCPDDPHATSSTSGSIWRMARAVSAATRPYSSAVLWPVCQGPSISLPRHQSLMPKGSLSPCSARRSDRAVPEGWLASSWSSSASATPRVPRLTAIMGSACGPIFFRKAMYSERPKRLVSVERQARSRRRGRSSTGPTESSHL